VSNSIVVSVVCTTYNQQAYIAQAVDSFLAQRLSVPYEIIIHDDASTDGTREILKSYAERYPDVIKVIQQQTINIRLGRGCLISRCLMQGGSILRLAKEMTSGANR
jgi:Glycosyltransferases involved in cell wall biogenesis